MRRKPRSASSSPSERNTPCVYFCSVPTGFIIAKAAPVIGPGTLNRAPTTRSMSLRLTERVQRGSFFSGV
ncbi:hypothetical protein N234_08945 [Ralstonia pickettii DTP0602]|nr:hypothetical protein N234_08945 [Ralstonia pickettii DTP0602]